MRARTPAVRTWNSNLRCATSRTCDPEQPHCQLPTLRQAAALGPGITLPPVLLRALQDDRSRRLGERGISRGGQRQRRRTGRPVRRIGIGRTLTGAPPARPGTYPPCQLARTMAMPWAPQRHAICRSSGTIPPNANTGRLAPRTKAASLSQPSGIEPG